MADSNITFIRGTPITVGNHGDTDYVYEKNAPVLNAGDSSLVFESGIGLGSGVEPAPLTLYTWGGNGTATAEFWDPETDGWYTIADTPASGTAMAAYAGGGLYVQANDEDIYQYNVATDAYDFEAPGPVPNEFEDGTGYPAYGDFYVGAEYFFGSFDPEFGTTTQTGAPNAFFSDEGCTLATVNAANERIHYAGGDGRDHYRYRDFDSNFEELADIPDGFANYCASAGANGEFYLFGGTNGSSDTARAAKYDYTTDSWSSITDLPEAVSGAKAVARDGPIHIVGGNQRVHYEYDPGSDSYTARARPNAQHYFGGLAGVRRQAPSTDAEIVYENSYNGRIGKVNVLTTALSPEVFYGYSSSANESQGPINQYLDVISLSMLLMICGDGQLYLMAGFTSPANVYGDDYESFIFSREDAPQSYQVKNNPGDTYDPASDSVSYTTHNWGEQENAGWCKGPIPKNSYQEFTWARASGTTGIFGNAGYMNVFNVIGQDSEVNQSGLMRDGTQHTLKYYPNGEP